MSLLPLYKRMIRGSSCFDPDEELITNCRSYRSLSVLPDMMSVPRYLPRARAISVSRDDNLGESITINESRFTNSDAMDRLRSVNILGHGDDSWLDRYLNNVQVPEPSLTRTHTRISRLGGQFPLKRRFLPSAVYSYKNVLPAFYNYPKEHHWSPNDPSGLGYLHSTPITNKKQWDWAYPHKSYTSNFSPSYIHYPRSRHEYIYPRSF